MSLINRDSALYCAVRNVTKAQKLDGTGCSRDAYVQYLQSVQHIVGDLLFATTQSAYSRPDDPKLIKLAQQCLDRAGELCSNNSLNSDGANHAHCHGGLTPDRPQTAPVTSVTSLPFIPVTSPTTSEPGSTRPRSLSSVSSSSASNQQSSPNVQKVSRESTPMKIAMQQNQKLISAYRARMAKLGKHEASNLSLSLQRRLAENVALAKKREAALQKRINERHKRLLQEAEERLQFTTGMDKSEQERRQMYVSVREYEQDTKWLLPLKEKLEESPDNENIQQDLIKQVLNAPQHPLTVYSARHQYAVYDKIKPLLDKFRSRMLPNQGAETTEPETPSNPDTTTPLSPTTALTHTKPHGEDEQDEFDYLFESDDHANHDGAAKAKPERTDVAKTGTGEKETTEDTLDESNGSAPLDLREDGDVIESQSDVITPLDNLEQEALRRHIENIVQDIHHYLEKIKVMYTVVYEQLDTATGRELIYSSIETVFYQPICGYILELFRLAHYDKELTLRVVLEKHLTSPPEEFKLPERLLLRDAPEDSTTDDETNQTPAEPYEKVITELRSITGVHSPLGKLECIVKVSRQICSCVEEWYTERSIEVPTIGADDLVPVLCYIVVQAQVHQLVAETQAMEELMHEGYLMGEEGYCLASLQTALGYILSLANN